VSDVLTRPDDFHSAPLPPSMQSMRPQLERELTANIRRDLAAAVLSAGVAGTSPVLTSPVSMHRASSATPEGLRQWSPAALTERAVRARLEEFGKAVAEAIELSDAMVAENEAAPINYQTLTYAVEALAPLIVAMGLSSPLMLPLQNGGIGAEWHDVGMNIELRFRSPYHVYAVLEDARGAIPPFHGRDPHLVHTRLAMRRFATRAVGY
jgi:hypothetical protein